MKHALLNLLVCPSCQGQFSLGVEVSRGDEVVHGTLVCHDCATTFPVIRGIPRILAGGLGHEQKRTAEAFGWEWTRFSRLHDQRLYTEQFLDWIAPLSADDVRGGVVLDAGCGMGRFSGVCRQLGAREVVAVDISLAVEAAYENTRHLPDVHVVQADIHNLPFAKDPGDFDLVFSIGVLHHLSSPEAGFTSLVRHLRPGGTIATWVYGYENNEWLVRYVNPLRRWITSRLPHRALFVLSFVIALPLHLVLTTLYRPADRWSVVFLRRWLPYRYLFWLSRFGLRHTFHVVFDHLVAPEAAYLRREEFAAWFERAGLADTTVTARNENSWRGYGRKPLASGTRTDSHRVRIRRLGDL